MKRGRIFGQMEYLVTPVAQYVVVFGMEDYPRSLAELESRFRTQQACRDYLMKLRWPEGFVCPRCSAQSAWTSNRNLLVCV